MRDVLGWRKKFGVLGPSTNTIVQPDFEMMRPPGVTNHYSRIFTPNAQAVSNETFMAGTQVIGENTLEAVRSVMTCSPDYLVMGMSAVTFYGGAKGADAFQARVEKEAGVGISIGSHSCTAAVKTYGGGEGIGVFFTLYSGRKRAGRALFHRLRIRSRSRRLPAMQKLDGDCRGAARRAAGEAHCARRQRPRRGRDRSGRHQSEHGAPCRGGGDVARQADRRHQHRD